MPGRKRKPRRITEEIGVRPPCDRHELRNHIQAVFFQQLRRIARMTDAASAWRVLRVCPSRPADLLDGSYTAEQLAPYSTIQATPFARTLELMYDYAYFGVLDASSERMCEGSTYTAVASILCASFASYTAADWLSVIDDDFQSVEVCQSVAETANARRVLEGQEEFFCYFNEHGSTGDALTVREIALLAGIEEMSVRAALSRTRVNQLRSYSEDGRTLIKAAHAKAWLEAAGRYVPVRLRSGSEPLDLRRQRFPATLALCSALISHYEDAVANRSDAAEINNALQAIGITSRDDRFQPGVTSIDIEPRHLADNDVVEKLARALRLDPELLILRKREARASEELADVQQKLMSKLGTTTKDS